MNKYRDFRVEEGQYYPNLGGGNTVKKLKPGFYSLNYNMMSREFWFDEIAITMDSILDLPSPEFTQIVKEIKDFMSPETRKSFLDLGFVYKRSTLLHGKPGTGKTIISNRIALDIIKNDGIVLWVENPGLLPLAYEVLTDIQPDTLIGVIFEEFDSVAKKYESMLLTLLDGQVQKNNVIYLATTNYIEDVPKRLYRPGRFSSVIEINFPIPEARLQYLITKVGKKFKDLQKWVDATSGCSIDELKEIVQACYILKQPFETVLQRINDTKGIVANDNVVPFSPTAHATAVVDTLNAMVESTLIPIGSKN